MQLSCISFRHTSKKNPKTLSPVTVISTQEKVIPPMTLSLKRNKNVPLFFFFKRDFSLPLVTKPMMSLKHKRNFILKGKHFRFHGHWSYELNWTMHISNRVVASGWILLICLNINLTLLSSFQIQMLTFLYIKQTFVDNIWRTTCRFFQKRIIQYSCHELRGTYLFCVTYK